MSNKAFLSLPSSSIKKKRKPQIIKKEEKKRVWKSHESLLCFVYRKKKVFKEQIRPLKKKEKEIFAFFL